MAASDSSMDNGGMDSRRLLAFVTVAELGGITAAASKLGYAQSSLSAQLRSLETELGVDVLSRGNGGASLTDAGLRLLPFAREALDLHERMRLAVTSARPRIRIGALETLADEWLPDILAAYDRGAAGPGAAADVELAVANRRQLLADLASGKLDLIFLFDNAEPANGPHATVAADRVLLVAAPEHPLAQSGPIELDALRGVEFLIAEPGCTSNMLFDRFGRDVTYEAPISMVTGSLRALVRLATHGRGVALLPALTAARSLASGELIEIAVRDGLPAINIEARWRERRDDGGVVEALIRLARRHQPIREAEASLAEAA
jgi:DNA-binding transcriptional LysR family regulator